MTNKLYSCIVKPVITEKSSLATQQGKQTFIVNKSATKIDVKNAIQALYGVKVKAVNVITIRPKTRIGKGRKPVIKRKEYKKAIVTFKEKIKEFDITKFKEKKKS